ncbi:MAG: ImmA/IrrE family metallo-endopeptidase [Rhizomicrobium sp.]
MSEMSSLDARQIIAKSQKTAPVQVVPIAGAFGLKVYTANDWDDEISGMIVRDAERGGSSGYAVYVNGKHALVRRRFTIAHEIAHYVLHRSLIGGGVQDDALYRSKLSSAVEAEANRFAADILMPWRLLNEEIGKGNNNVEALARAFNVSKSSMSIRLGVPYETTAA